MILRPNRASKVKANLRTKGKNYTKNEDLCVNDSCKLVGEVLVMRCHLFPPICVVRQIVCRGRILVRKGNFCFDLF